jgi:hypothetical protein
MNGGNPTISAGRAGLILAPARRCFFCGWVDGGWTLLFFELDVVSRGLVLVVVVCCILRVCILSEGDNEKKSNQKFEVNSLGEFF